MSAPAKIERRRIFVGCEGESETGYSACLSSMARDLDLPVTIDARVMSEGDPLSRIEWAVKFIEREEERREPYAVKFAFLDTDQRMRDPERAGRAMTLAVRHGITIIWQHPDHEGLLLLHFEHNEKRRPSTPAESMRALEKVWTGYEKNSTARQYLRKLTRENVERAAGRHEELRRLIAAIGLVQEVSGKTDDGPVAPKSGRQLDLSE